jgi:type 1 glutamine amidotransferase
MQNTMLKGLVFFGLSIIIASASNKGKKHSPSFRVLAVASLAKDHVKMIDSARPFLERLAAENNFEIDITKDSSVINDDNLSKYQVFIMLHLAPFDMSYQQQDALQKFIERGNGWVGIHAAGLTGKNFHPGAKYWQWFEDFMGGITYSPHPAFQKAMLVVEDRNHPAMANLPPSFELPDEWYEFDKSPRGAVHVLAHVDESTYKQNKPMGDHPIIWTNEKYNMIYIGVGHDASLCADKNYQTLVRNAILWTASKTK